VIADDAGRIIRHGLLMKSGNKHIIRGKQDILSVFLEIETALRQYLMRFLVRKQDIEDIVQETFIRSFEAEKRQKIQSHKSFLFKVAENLALSEPARKSNQLNSLHI
jgi:RNA polymerase sigma-70 factor (ECF subfamily)